MPNFLRRLFRREPPLTTPQKVEAEREQRVTLRDRVDYSYTVFWTKEARLWDTRQRSEVWQQVNALIQSPEFAANPYNRTYMVDGVNGAHAGASLIALQKVLEALQAES